MNPDEIKHFLVSYDLDTDETEVESFGTDYDAAQAAYAEAERANAEAHRRTHVVRGDSRGDGMGT